MAKPRDITCFDALPFNSLLLIKLASYYCEKKYFIFFSFFFFCLKKNLCTSSGKRIHILLGSKTFEQRTQNKEATNEKVLSMDRKIQDRPRVLR